ncbi:hypothetical protein ABZ958_17510 [Streptomyces sp. NPDC046237]|uniref:hypothetical protein n=1 Tax=Streptomyces sp. NPDC046237 TaxID=3154914 RepID=UPI0033CDC222
MANRGAPRRRDAPLRRVLADRLRALAPAGRIGHYQGFYGTGVPGARTLGPLLVTALLVTWGVPGWLLLGGIFLLTGAATKPVVSWAASAPAPMHQPPTVPRARHGPLSRTGGVHRKNCAVTA